MNEEQFRLEAIRERIRADRNCLPLSILVIELPADRSTLRDLAFLAKILRRRLRITDRAGHLTERRIGVLLPDTPKEGAWKVASDVCDFYPVGHERPNCEVYQYPDESTPPRNDSPQLGRQSNGDVGVPIKELFIQPTPMVKRAVDVLGASLGLAIAAPLMLVLAAAIKLTSRGPVFFSQMREGLGGRQFCMYKFRTMLVDAHEQQSTLRAQSEQDGPAFKMRDDPRITGIGRFLRQTSVDELPQLWNVLLGDMSLVGPRPLPVEESLQCAPWQRRRLAVVPGLTCIWQVRGRSTVSFESWMRMDLEYVRRQSVSYDAWLMLSTIPSLLLQKGPR